MALQPTRRFAFTAGLAVVAAPSIVFAKDTRLSAREILLRNEIAMGGARAWRAIHSVESVVRIFEQGSAVIGRYRASKSGKARIDVFVKGDRVFSEGVDEAGSWQWPGGKPAAETAPAAANGILERGIEANLNSLRELADNGATFSLAPDVDGGGLVPMKRVLRDGYVDYIYLDPHDWLVKRQRDVRAIHPAIDDAKKPLENQYDDYRLVNGVRTPFQSRQIDVRSGAVLQTTTILRHAYNLPDKELDLSRAFVAAKAPAES